MRRENYISVGEAIDAFIKRHGGKSAIMRGKVIATWEKVVGEKTASLAGNRYLSGKTLYITMNSSVVRNVLASDNVQIINRLNEELGGEYVKRIVLK